MTSHQRKDKGRLLVMTLVHVHCYKSVHSKGPAVLPPGALTLNALCTHRLQHTMNIHSILWYARDNRSHDHKLRIELCICMDYLLPGSMGDAAIRARLVTTRRLLPDLAQKVRKEQQQTDLLFWRFHSQIYDSLPQTELD